jgi:hypothetical protein
MCGRSVVPAPQGLRLGCGLCMQGCVVVGLGVEECDCLLFD